MRIVVASLMLCIGCGTSTPDDAAKTLHEGANQAAAGSAKGAPAVVFRRIRYVRGYAEGVFELRNPTSSVLVYRGFPQRSYGEIKPLCHCEIVPTTVQRFRPFTCLFGESVENRKLPAEHTAVFYVDLPKPDHDGDALRIGVDLKLKAEQGDLATVWSSPVRWKDLQAR